MTISMLTYPVSGALIPSDDLVSPIEGSLESSFNMLRCAKERSWTRDSSRPAISNP